MGTGRVVIAMCLCLSLVACSGGNTDTAELDRLRQDAELQGQRACVRRALDGPVSKVTGDVAGGATLLDLDRQDLTNCLPEFVEAFVRFRSAAHAHDDAETDLAKNEQQYGNAVGRDLGRATCLAVFGEGCATGSAALEWQRRKELLIERRDQGRAGQRERLAEVEAVAARFGLSSRAADTMLPSPDTAPGVNDDMSDVVAENVM